VPGLNVIPSAMQALVEWLNDGGSHVFLVKLSGHHADSVGITEVTQEIWVADMLEGYGAARAAAGEQGVPLHFLGYSLGALLGQFLLAMPGHEIRFDKQVLFAPATAIRKRNYLLKLLFGWDSLTLPSYAPERYKANRRLPMRIYKIMFEMEAELWKMGRVSVPTLVFLDPRDELISYKKIRRYFGMGAVIVPLSSRMRGRYGGYHHLIINASTMGETNWALVVEKMRSFLIA
jgi:esterase/lipase